MKIGVCGGFLVVLPIYDQMTVRGFMKVLFGSLAKIGILFRVRYYCVSLVISLFASRLLVWFWNLLSFTTEDGGSLSLSKQRSHAGDDPKDV